MQRCGSTLIICPHKIRSQWEMEIRARTKAGALKVCVALCRVRYFFLLYAEKGDALCLFTDLVAVKVRVDLRRVCMLICREIEAVEFRRIEYIPPQPALCARFVARKCREVFASIEGLFSKHVSGASSWVLSPRTVQHRFRVS